MAFSDAVKLPVVTVRSGSTAEGSEALAEYVLTAKTGSMPPLSLPR